MRPRIARHVASFLPLLCCLLFGLTPLAAHAIDMDVLIGFGQNANGSSRYRPDAWTPLTVYLSGQSTKGTGQLQITLDLAGRVTTYTRRILLRDGTMNQAEGFVLNLHNIELYGQSISRDIEIQLLADGRKLASKKMALSVPIDSGAYTVLALTRDNSGLNFLTKKKLGLLHRHTNPNMLNNQRMMGNNSGNGDTEHNGIDPNAILQLLYTDLRALPAMPQGYEAIDALALADQPLDSLTDAQTAAIKTYVRQGGLLIVSGGGDLARLRSEFFADLLPLVPQAVTSARFLPTLESRYQSPLGLTVPTALTAGTLVPGASVLLPGPSSSTPLVTSRPYGAGNVVFTAFDYTDPTFRGWSAAAPLWRDLLRTGNEAISAREILDTATTFGGSGQRMVDALAGKQASSFPHWGVLTAFLITYILLLLPVNYLILKRFDRRELGWISIPILIVAFVITSYVIALSIKGGMLSANRAVIVETQANTPIAAGYGQMTLYSPRRANYDITIASDNASDAQPFSLRNGIGGWGGSVHDLTVDSSGGESSIRGALIRLWDKRSFDTSLNVSLGNGIGAQTRMISATEAEVVITNHTPYTLTHCALIADDLRVELGDLMPEQKSAPHKVKWTVRPNATNIALMLQPDQLPLSSRGIASLRGKYELPPNNSNNSPGDVRRIPVDLSTPDKITLALSDTLKQGWDWQQYGYGEGGRGYGRSVNAFVGWFDAPLMSPRIDGRPAPQGDEVNLLVAHLPAPPNAPPKIRALANPFTQKPVLNLEEQLLPGARKTSGKNDGVKTMISNPVLRKELLIRMRFGRMPTVQRIGVSIGIVISLGYIYYQVFNLLHSDPHPSTGHGAWAIITGLQFAFVCLLAPVAAANAITQEREQMTWEMLIFTQLRPSEIIMGKLLARMLIVALILLLGFPAALFALFYANTGGSGSTDYIPPLQFLGAYVAQFIMGLFFATFGLFMSWLLKRTLYAIMAAYTFVVLGLFIGTGLLTFMLSSLVGDYNFFTNCPLMWFNPIQMILEVMTPSRTLDSLNLIYGLIGYAALTALMLWRMISGFRRFAFES